MLFLFYGFTSTAQTYTKKYNSINGRYEYFNSNGTMVGYEKYNSISNSWEYYTVTNDNNPYNRKPIEVAPVQSNVNLELIDRVMAKKQQDYDNQQSELLRQLDMYYENLKEVSMSRLRQVQSFYNSANSYPSIIKNGWHIVCATNNYNFCEQRKVFVENNKVTKYVIDDWKIEAVVNSSSVQKCKALIRLYDSDDHDDLEVYFLDAISNPNGNSTPPVQSGKVSFYTTFNRGNVDIYVEDLYIGTLKSYFNDSQKPLCGQNGTVIFENKPGTYKYEAVSNNATWSGTITIYSNTCSSFKLKG